MSNKKSELNTKTYELFALRYGSQSPRELESIFTYPCPDGPPRDFEYFYWLARSDDELILIDCGFSEAQANGRNKKYLSSPRVLLGELNISADDIDTLIITHLHYDHAGSLESFPNATVYLQNCEFGYCTSDAMADNNLSEHYESEDVAAIVEKIHRGKVVFLEGDTELRDGITVTLVGGHCPGQQVVSVRTERGMVVLASDAAHYTDNLFLKNPYPVYVNEQDVLNAYNTIEALADAPENIIGGHDPKVLLEYPQVGKTGNIVALHEVPHD